MKSLSKRLEQLKHHDITAYTELINCFKIGSKPKGTHLVKIGEVCKHLYIIQQGLARHYRYDEEGKEYNTWFSFEQQIVLPICSFHNKTPTKVGVQLIEDTKFQYISAAKLMPLLQKHHSLETLFREVFLSYYIEMEDRLHRIQAYSAEKKYGYIVAHQPYLLERMSQHHIASYLGISRETLSRIRAKHRSS